MACRGWGEQGMALSTPLPMTGKRQHKLSSPQMGSTLGVPFGPLEWEVSEIHDLRQ